MLKHYYGVKKIKDRVEHHFAFAETTGKAEGWIFDEVAKRLVFDEEIRRRLQLNNPYAIMKIAELLIEAGRRDIISKENRKIIINQDVLSVIAK